MRFMDSMREDMRVAGVTEVTDLTSQKRNDSTKQFFFLSIHICFILLIYAKLVLIFYKPYLYIFRVLNCCNRTIF